MHYRIVCSGGLLSDILDYTRMTMQLYTNMYIFRLTYLSKCFASIALFCKSNVYPISNSTGGG